MRFRWRRSTAACTLLLALACSEGPPLTRAPIAESPYSDYLGRYRLNDDLVLVVSDLHYGVEDSSVVVANGIALRDRLEELGRTAPDHQVTLHEGVGHSMPYPWAFDQTREFFLRHLVEPASEETFLSVTFARSSCCTPGRRRCERFRAGRPCAPSVAAHASARGRAGGLQSASVSWDCVRSR